jgi:hypothetical protein
VLLAEINRIMTHKEVYEKMSEAGKSLDYSRDASTTIALEALRIALSHYE